MFLCSCSVRLCCSRSQVSPSHKTAVFHSPSLPVLSSNKSWSQKQTREVRWDFSSKPQPGGHTNHCSLCLCLLASLFEAQFRDWIPWIMPLQTAVYVILFFKSGLSLGSSESWDLLNCEGSIHWILGCPGKLRMHLQYIWSGLWNRIAFSNKALDTTGLLQLVH